MATSTDKGPKISRRTLAVWIAAVFLLLACLISVTLVLIGSRRPAPPVIQDEKLLDAAQISALISKQCALGGKTEVEGKISAELARYVSGLSSGSSVSTSDVGALIEKITPNEGGLAFYKAYTDCLKQQTAILLDQRGVSLVPPSEKDVEARQDEQMWQAVSNIGANTPVERLEQLFGAPVSDMSRWAQGFETTFYQYKTSIFVLDYRKDGERVALAISTKDPNQGSAIFFDQIRGVTLGTADRDCDGIEMSGRMNVRSGVCPSSNASNNVKSVFYFLAITLSDGPRDNALCRKALNDQKKVDYIKLCPDLAESPAIAVLIADEDRTDDNSFRQAAAAFFDELDFGGSFSWRNDAENLLMEKHDATFPDSGTEAEQDAWMAADQQKLLKKAKMKVVPGPTT